MNRSPFLVISLVLFVAGLLLVLGSVILGRDAATAPAPTACGTSPIFT